MRIMHRDMKLDNILVHFPNRPNTSAVNYDTVDLENELFVVKIADLGYAREFKNPSSGDGRGTTSAGRDRAFSFKGSPLMMPAEQI